jgi:hypothetical protein
MQTKAQRESEREREREKERDLVNKSRSIRGSLNNEANAVKQ